MKWTYYPRFLPKKENTIPIQGGANIGDATILVMLLMVSRPGGMPWIRISNRNMQASFVAHIVKMDCLSSS
jgi:hypothetical protein